MRISQKEKSLLGYTISKTQGSYPDNPDSFSSPNRNSDIDFSDVFGGPPRRSSLQDVRRRFYDDEEDEDSGERNGDDVNGGGDALACRSSWSGSGTPVFGTEVTGRIRHPKEGFYGDIFGGDQPPSPSPRMGGKDRFSSPPRSRVLSPIRPVTPSGEPLGSPAPFSLPARLVSPKYSSQGVHSHDMFSSYRPSPLSSSSSYNDIQDALRKEAKVDDAKAGPGFNEEPQRNSVSIDNENHFHFSIYRWASKGVPLFTSLHRGSTRFKEKRSGGLNRSFSSNGRAETNTVVGEIQQENGTTDDSFSYNVTLVSIGQDSIESESVIDQAVPSTTKSRLDDKLQDRGDDLRENLHSSSLHHGIEGHEGIKSVIGNAGGKDNIPSHVTEVEKSKPKGSTRTPKENLERGNGNSRKVKEKNGNNGVQEKFKENNRSNADGKGKVKDFVKIFNQESPAKQINLDGGVRTQKRWEKVNASDKTGNATGVNLGKKHGDTQASDVSGESYSSSKLCSRQANGNHIPFEDMQFDATSISETHHRSMQEEKLSSTDGFVPERTKFSTSNNDDYVMDEETIFIKELLEINERPVEGNEDDQYIQVSDSKILQWSKGKEGNIRALLSTLQYVLWPNSGWKPVPLVNIIEGSSVKRAYQRALLCLHPDKLQQKGAAAHEKYIASKVFEILQEAWDQFNSIGSL